ELSSKTHLSSPPPPPTVLRFLRCRGDGCRGGNSNSHHRRAHSDLLPSNLFTGGSITACLEEIGSEDDLFSTYINVEMLSGGEGASNDSVHTRNGSDQNGYGGARTSGNEEDKSPGGSESNGTGGARPRHRDNNHVLFPHLPARFPLSSAMQERPQWLALMLE
ncbi:hypothetical protein PIB30_087278, partial [Stylosanthes scabra]|nr:hypothetical protein [Stylosanthes scabra]